jgi:hypothetical protein
MKDLATAALDGFKDSFRLFAGIFCAVAGTIKAFVDHDRDINLLDGQFLPGSKRDPQSRLALRE